jgi:hypothetical protein
MPPREEKKFSQKGKQSEKTDAATKTVKKSTNVVLRQPVYLDMGKKRVQFLHNAAELDQVLKKTYGTSFSISKLEKSLIELKGKSALRDLIHLPNEILALHSAYLKSKVEMAEESSLLKKSFLAAPIASSAIFTADELFAEPSSSQVEKTFFRAQTEIYQSEAEEEATEASQGEN